MTETKTTNETPQFHSREERKKLFGLDMAEELVWQGGQWAAGGEFLKKLYIKNVSTRVLHIRYKLPATKFFSMDFPKTITLSPGVGLSLDVMFRPIKNEEYDDFIQIKSESGAFRVPVRAKLASLHIEFPENVHFGSCPTNEIEQRTFVVENVGEVDANFAWKFTKPFWIEPARGSVPAKSKMTLTANYLPTEITVVVSTAWMVINGKQEQKLTLSGTGKYPFLLASSKTIDFGWAQIGTPKAKLTKTFQLTNHSEVVASFKSRVMETDRPTRFSVSPSEGHIPPKSTFDIQVRFNPKSEGDFACDSFIFETPGGNAPIIMVKGMAGAPPVQLYKKLGQARPGIKDPTLATKLKTNSINFGDVECGSNSSRAVVIRNGSAIPCAFHFMAEELGSFRFDKVQGVATGLLETAILLHFRPPKPGNYVRRVFCLFEHGPPQCLDLIGTAYDHTGRPQPIKQRHLDRFRNRQQLGLSRLSPEQLDKKLKQDERLEAKLQAPPVTDLSQTRSGASTVADVNLTQEFFHRVCNPKRDVVLQEEQINFGRTSRLRAANKQTVHVVNNTGAKIVCSWRMPGSEDGDEQADFSVFPETQEIAAGRTGPFKVSFRPSQDNFYYCSELECYCYYKTQRNFRLVNDESFTPPWCLTLRAIGHTFAASNEQFIPDIKFHTRRLNFPACHLGDSVFLTTRITNNGNTPALFRFKPDPANVFDVRPTGGLIDKGKFQLVSFRFRPKEVIHYFTQLECVMNNTHVVKLPTTGISCMPRVKFDNGQSVLFFKPTCLGIVSKRIVTLRNSTRIPVRFRWALPSRLRKVILPSPMEGFIRGNETVDITFNFAPRMEKLYRFKLHCFFFTSETDPLATRNCDLPVPDGMRQRLVRQNRLLSISILGEGTSGAISFSPQVMDFKTLLLGTKGTMSLEIKNNSDCNLKFGLEVVKKSEVHLLDEDNDGVVEADELDKYQAARADDVGANPEIVFDFAKGVLPARASKNILVTFCPAFPGKQDFRVFWELDADNGYGNAIKNTELGSSVKGDPLFCEIIGEAGYPTLQFTDVRSNDGLGPDWLWEQFNLNALNTSLARPLTKKDIKYNNTEGMNQDPSCLDTYDFNFTPRAINSETMVATFEIKNVGALPVDFFFKLPNDLDVEIENWADAGEPSAEQTRITGILSNGLFKIHPRRGRLAQHESQQIRIDYNYIITDPVLGEEHVMPAILQLKKGKQVRIMLRGRTLESDQTHLRVLKNVFEHEMPIGQPVAPEFPLRIFNPSSVSLAYEVDMNALTNLKKDNYGCDVIKCENPKGVLESGQIAAINWKFKPLEAKTYNISSTVSYFPPGRLTRPRQLAKMKVPLQVTCHGTHHVKGTKKAKSKIKKPKTSLPTTQKVMIPGQTAKLSHDHIDFGDIPQDAKTHRLVVLRGLGASATRYQWDDQHPLILSKRLKIYPMSGTVKAGSHVVLRISLKANTMPSTVASEVACVLIPVSDDGQPLAEERKYLSGISTDAYLTADNNPAASVAGKTHYTSYTSKTSSKSYNSTKKQKPQRESVITARTASHVNREAANTRTSVNLGLPVTQELARRDNRPRPPDEDEEETPIAEVGPRQVVLHLAVRFNIRGRESLANKADFYSSGIEDPDTPVGGEGLQMNKNVSAHKKVLLALTDSMIRDAVRDTTVMDTVHELRRVGSDQVIPLYEQLVADEACGPMKEGDKGLEEPLRVDVCHRVLEETFYNLIQEALQGELRLDRPPRVVLNRE